MPELRLCRREGKKEVNYNERDIFKAEEALARAEAKSRSEAQRRSFLGTALPASARFAG